MSLIDDAIAAAKKYGIDPGVFVRQIQQESGFNPNARSPAGAEGVAQFMPGTAAGLGINPWDPQQALNAAARYDANNLRAYGGDWAKVLAAYNAGGGAVNYAIARGGKNWRNFLPAETQNYLRIILGGKGNPPPVSTPTPVASPGHPSGIVEPHITHVDPFGQPYTLSLSPQQATVRPQPLFKQPQAFNVQQQQTPAPTPTPKPRTVFGIPFTLSVPRQPSVPVQKPKATRPSPAPKPAPVSKTTKKTGKHTLGGPF